MFAVASPSLLDLTGKERGTVNGGWRVESIASVAAHPVERAEIAILVETEIVTNDSGYAWKALSVPPIAPPTVVVVGFAVVGGF